MGNFSSFIKEGFDFLLLQQDYVFLESIEVPRHKIHSLENKAAYKKLDHEDEVLCGRAVFARNLSSLDAVIIEDWKNYELEASRHITRVYFTELSSSYFQGLGDFFTTKQAYREVDGNEQEVLRRRSNISFQDFLMVKTFAEPFAEQVEEKLTRFGFNVVRPILPICWFPIADSSNHDYPFLYGEIYLKNESSTILLARLRGSSNVLGEGNFSATLHILRKGRNPPKLYNTLKLLLSSTNSKKSP